MAAVRAARIQPYRLKLWYDRIDLNEIAGSRAKVAIKTDGKQRTWMLFHSAIHGELFITYGPDHKSAHVTISRYSGGLNGDGIEVSLIKVGDDWFVVDLEMRYVSRKPKRTQRFRFDRQRFMERLLQVAEQSR